MTLLAAYVAGPYEGISQAPPAVRLPGACQDMQDCHATIPLGVQKRPPFEFIGMVTSTGAGDAYSLYGEFPRGSAATDITYVLSNEAGVIKCYFYLTSDPTCTQIPVTITAEAAAYLATNNPVPNRDFRAVSIEDYTFITNRTVEVVNTGDTASTRPYEGLLWCKIGEYARDYVFSFVDQNPAGALSFSMNYLPATGSASGDARGVATGVVTAALAQGASAIPSGSGGTYNGPSGGISGQLANPPYDLILNGSTLYIANASFNFTPTTSDDQGSTAMYFIKDSVQNFSDLPEVGVQGMVVEVLQSEGNANAGTSNFYVQYTATSPPTGVWQECIQPGAPLGVNPLTLPVALFYDTSTSAWTIDVQPWKRRQTGNVTLSPDPGFVGDYITDIKWYRGRLELVYNGGSVFSDSADPFNYYTTTLAANLESDPLGFLTPVERKSFFKQAVNFDNRAVLFGDKVQAIISSTGVFSSDNARIDELGDYDFNDNVPVQASNHRCYFMSTTSVSSLVYELAINQWSGLALTQEMTTAVPTLLPPNLDRGSTLKSFYISVYGASNGSQLYIHVPRYQDQQRVQNAFYTWNIPTGWTLAGLFFKNSVLRILMRAAIDGNLYQFSQEFAPLALDLAPASIRSWIDFKLPESVCTTSYNAATNITVVTSPIVPAPGYIATVRGTGGANGYPEGYLIPIVARVGHTLSLKGDWTTGTFYLGLRYTSYFIPTEWYVLGQDGKPQHSGRLSLRRIKFDVSNFGYLRVEVNVAGRATRTKLFEGVYLDDPSRAGLNAPPDSLTRVLEVPIGGNSKDTYIKVINDSHLGFALLGYEWQGDFSPRARRA